MAVEGIQGRNSRSETEGGSKEECFLWLTHIIQGPLPEDQRYTPTLSWVLLYHLTMKTNFVFTTHRLAHRPV